MKRRTVIGILVGFASFATLGGLLTLSDPLLRMMVLGQCPLDERWEYALPGSGGYTVTYFERNCALYGSAYEEGVFAERSRFPWPWPERKYVFSYEPKNNYSGRTIQIVPTGPSSVTLSAENVREAYLAETNWGTLNIDYNIGSIDNPRPTDPPTVGASWAERQKLLQNRARELGTAVK
jgi:hypothetical protein